MAGKQHHPVARFLANIVPETITKQGCWQWSGAGKGNGYGAFSLNGKAIQAHRAAFILFNHFDPVGQDVCHVCDNRSCVNPDHLFVGSRSENMADAMRKGRLKRRKGAHLKEVQIQEVRRLYLAGQRIANISRSTGISHATISNLIQGV